MNAAGQSPTCGRFNGTDLRMRPDLASCYGQERLPRYTSYPTAPHFSATSGPSTYAGWLAAIPQQAAASPLSAHPLLSLGVLVLWLQYLRGPTQGHHRRLHG